MELSRIDMFGTTLELESAFNEAYRYATESHVNISVEDADHVHDSFTVGQLHEAILDVVSHEQEIATTDSLRRAWKHVDANLHNDDADFVNPKVMKYIVMQAFVRLMADEADIVAYVSR